MIYKCNSSDNSQILSYIGTEHYKCLYLYMNYLKYGTHSDTIGVYIQTSTDGIQAIFLTYYSCIHIFSRQNTFSLQEFNAFLNEHPFSMIYCKKATALYIWNSIEKNSSEFSISFGWVAQLTSLCHKRDRNVEMAKKEDFRQIAEMICADEDIGRSYNIDNLAKQLYERNQEGYTRNVVIKDGKVVVAHACTNAEINGIAVVGELVVNKEYRRQGYGSDIWCNLCYTLLNENKEIYSFYYSDVSRALHRKMGFREVCEWGKIVVSPQQNRGLKNA